MVTSNLNKIIINNKKIILSVATALEKKKRV